MAPSAEPTPEPLARAHERPPYALEARVDALNARAWNLRRQDPEQALAQAEKAGKLAKDYVRGRAESLLTLSFIKIGTGDVDAAETSTRKAEALLDAESDQGLRAKVHNLLGIIHGERGELPQALHHMLKAQALFEQAAEPREAASSLGNAAVIYTYLGNYERALELYVQVLNLQESIADAEGSARTLSGLGMAYYEMGEYQDALTYLLRSLSLEATKNDANAQALVLMNIGRAYTALGKLDDALSYTRQGATKLEALGDRSGLSYALDTLGTIHLKRANPDEAQRFFERSLMIKADLGDRIGQAMTRLAIGQLLLNQSQLENAESTLLKALGDARGAEGKSEIYKIHLALADVYEKGQDFQAALRHHRAYAKVKDEVFNETSDRNLQSLRMGFQVSQAEKEREIYRLKNIELAKANAQKEELVSRLEQQTREDVLTGLFNRRYFDTYLAKAFAEAQAKQEPLSLMMCDLDHFKRINDNFSHQIGDKVLIVFAEIFSKLIRKTDTLARYGGEEFILLMPNTHLEEAYNSCERLRQAFEAYAWQDIAPGLNVTLSGGLTADMSVATGEKLVARADMLLYKAKRSGRNQIRTDRQ